ncbi:hypothetical protein BH11BAC7_BH11BAC7_35610 [soil metagenome]
MKLISTLVFFAAFCFSCSSFREIEKRHYRSGFYINKHHEKSGKGKLFVLEEDFFLEEGAGNPPRRKAAVGRINGASADCVSVHVLPGIKTEVDLQKSSLEKRILPESENDQQKKNILLPKKIILARKKTAAEISSWPIETPKEPFNKKARAAIVFYVLAKIILVAAFIASLFSLLGTVLIIAGIAALFALLALLFGILARKELAAQLPYEKGLGEKEANEVVGHAIGGIVSAAFILLLALVIEWIKREF